MLKTIALPADSEEVLIRNIPRLLTDATYPQMPEDYKVISCLQKRDVPDGTPDTERENISWETLTDGDWITLNRICEDSGLPPYRNNMCMSEWLPYAKAIEAQKLDLEITPGWTLLAFLGDNLESEHRKTLIDVLTNGKVAAYNQVTRIPLTSPIIPSQFDAAVMPVGDFISYAKKFDIQVQVDEKQDWHETASGEAAPNTGKITKIKANDEPLGKQSKRKRTNTLAEEYEPMLIANPKLTATQLMALLLKQIDKPHTCIMCATGDGLQWDEYNGKEQQKLTIKKLEDRIARWRKKQNTL